MQRLYRGALWLERLSGEVGREDSRSRIRALSKAHPTVGTASVVNFVLDKAKVCAIIWIVCVMYRKRVAWLTQESAWVGDGRRFPVRMQGRPGPSRRGRLKGE